MANSIGNHLSITLEVIPPTTIFLPVSRNGSKFAMGRGKGERGKERVKTSATNVEYIFYGKGEGTNSEASTPWKGITTRKQRYLLKEVNKT